MTTPRAPRTPRSDSGPPADRLREVGEAATRAFSLLPARPEDVSPPPAPGRSGTGGVARRLRTDPDTVERDLVRLVLTIVELLRQLMERQALHRVDQGNLTEDQEERLGMTLMVLHDRMTELCDRYGLTLDDLNLDLGPLGTLLPADPAPRT
ncbi:gas vesicle protein K [Streptomyces griseiscabiei]|uniref:Gas vesicle protein K n=1 Tax=Streptomyces griseiscabiei TaxID=2993540 RepID=A0ABU4LEX1_9ACTN|nr:gas vesicle protein K [Streptomyces griseiscabiei]MBZ3907209.1 gas vesicle protein K [Streptomyces griseiscabiei]MDX2914291.1 gas vesicle protein K [Streptomyces griseiscabiei]